MNQPSDVVLEGPLLYAGRLYQGYLTPETWSLTQLSDEKSSTVYFQISDIWGVHRCSASRDAFVVEQVTPVDVFSTDSAEESTLHARSLRFVVFSEDEAESARMCNEWRNALMSLARRRPYEPGVPVRARRAKVIFNPVAGVPSSSSSNMSFAYQDPSPEYTPSPWETVLAALTDRGPSAVAHADEHDLAFARSNGASTLHALRRLAALANMTFDISETMFAGHAREIARSFSPWVVRGRGPGTARPGADEGEPEEAAAISPVGTGSAAAGGAPPRLYDALIIVGGDRTVAEVVHGLLSRRTWPLAKLVPICILPTGVHNTLAHSLGFHDLTTCAQTLVTGLGAPLDVLSLSLPLPQVLLPAGAQGGSPVSPASPADAPGQLPQRPARNIFCLGGMAWGGVVSHPATSFLGSLMSSIWSRTDRNLAPALCSRVQFLIAAAGEVSGSQAIQRHLDNQATQFLKEHFGADPVSVADMTKLTGQPLLPDESEYPSELDHEHIDSSDIVSDAMRYAGPEQLPFDQIPADDYNMISLKGEDVWGVVVSNTCAPVHNTAAPHIRATTQSSPFDGHLDLAVLRNTGNPTRQMYRLCRDTGGPLSPALATDRRDAPPEAVAGDDEIIFRRVDAVRLCGVTSAGFQLAHTHTNSSSNSPGTDHHSAGAAPPRHPAPAIDPDQPLGDIIITPLVGVLTVLQPFHGA